MKKLKLYLDTSVISYLDQKDSPEKMAETRLFWEKIKTGEFDVVISDVVNEEIENCDEQKREVLFDYLAQIRYDVVIVDSHAIAIAKQFIDFHVLKQNSFDDCRHIAAAITSGCDAIVSWNFKHIVNHKTMAGVKAVAAINGYKDLLIYTPGSIAEGEYDDTL
ncbi:MAG: hypothetical protein Pg6C_05750 [Treponemataceae bacterium]|nr:MAG: hypothetical protein Pg6C_05750 [Treponemataceae bacterium]